MWLKSNILPPVTLGSKPMTEGLASLLPWGTWCVRREPALAGHQLTEPLPEAVGNSSHSFNSTEASKTVSQTSVWHFQTGSAAKVLNWKWNQELEMKWAVLPSEAITIPAKTPAGLLELWGKQGKGHPLRSSRRSDLRESVSAANATQD